MAEKARCETCLYWSDLVAEQTGNGPLMALCENLGGPKAGRMVSGRDTCSESEWCVDETPGQQCVREWFALHGGAAEGVSVLVDARELPTLAAAVDALVRRERAEVWKAAANIARRTCQHCIVTAEQLRARAAEEAGA